MNRKRLFEKLVGLVAGLGAALFMTVVMALLRLSLGIPLPAELGANRFLPYFSVGNFFSLIYVWNLLTETLRGNQR